MGTTTVQQTASGRVWDLARRQHGVLARRQLVEIGYGAAAIRHRLRTGRLHPLGRAVYAVGRPTVSRQGLWLAAVLACGEGAVLSHGSAAALWGIGGERRGIEVSVPLTRRPRRKGVTVHRRSALGPADLAVHEAIPVTGPAMTLLDHATRLGPGPMERMVNEGDKLDLVKPPSLRAFLENHPRQEGVARLKRLLDRRSFVFTETALEEWFLPIAAAAGLPVPLTGQRLNGFKVDFFWPGLGLVVETDGLRYHRTPAQQAHDRLRDQTHTAAGLTALRFTHDQIRHEGAHVRRVLIATARRLRRARA